MFTAHTGADNGMIVINDLLKVANTHWCSSQVIHLVSLLLVLLLLWLEPLLVHDELLLHQKKVLDPLHLQQPEAALGVGSHTGQLVGSIRTLHLLALLANPGGDWGLILLLLLFLSILDRKSTRLNSSHSSVSRMPSSA